MSSLAPSYILSSGSIAKGNEAIVSQHGYPLEPNIKPRYQIKQLRPGFSVAGHPSFQSAFDPITLENREARDRHV